VIKTLNKRKQYDKTRTERHLRRIRREKWFNIGVNSAMRARYTTYTHIILPRLRIKYVFCSFWNLALCQILPCTLPLLLPPLHYVLATTVYDIILRPQTHLWIAHNLNSFICVEIHRPVASHWQTISQNVVSNTSLHVRDLNSQR
jgi:hypothetical protein